MKTVNRDTFCRRQTGSGLIKWSHEWKCTGKREVINLDATVAKPMRWITFLKKKKMQPSFKRTALPRSNVWVIMWNGRPLGALGGLQSSTEKQGFAKPSSLLESAQWLMSLPTPRLCFPSCRWRTVSNWMAGNESFFSSSHHLYWHLKLCFYWTSITGHCLP